MITAIFCILAAFIGSEPNTGVNAQMGGMSDNGKDVNISALLNSFQMGYDKRVRPNYGGVAVTVGVSMYVLSISRLSEVDMVMLLPKTTYFYSLYHLLSFKKLLPIFADTAIAAMALMKL